jgi:hypothetical protein
VDVLGALGNDYPYGDTRFTQEELQRRGCRVLLEILHVFDGQTLNQAKRFDVRRELRGRLTIDHDRA